MIASTDTTYTIQQTARETGLSVDTLRYYERIGLVDRVARASNGHRRYSSQDIDRLTFLTKLRQTGMPLEQMRKYAALHRQPGGGVGGRIAMLSAHREEIVSRIDELTQMLIIIDYKIETLSQP